MAATSAIVDTLWVGGSANERPKRTIRLSAAMKQCLNCETPGCTSGVVAPRRLGDALPLQTKPTCPSPRSAISKPKRGKSPQKSKLTLCLKRKIPTEVAAELPATGTASANESPKDSAIELAPVEEKPVETTAAENLPKPKIASEASAPAIQTQETNIDEDAPPAKRRQVELHPDDNTAATALLNLGVSNSEPIKLSPAREAHRMRWTYGMDRIRQLEHDQAERIVRRCRELGLTEAQKTKCFADTAEYNQARREEHERRRVQEINLIREQEEAGVTDVEIRTRDGFGNWWWPNGGSLWFEEEVWSFYPRTQHWVPSL